MMEGISLYCCENSDEKKIRKVILVLKWVLKVIHRKTLVYPTELTQPSQPFRAKEEGWGQS